MAPQLVGFLLLRHVREGLTSPPAIKCSSSALLITTQRTLSSFSCSSKNAGMLPRISNESGIPSVSAVHRQRGNTVGDARYEGDRTW